MNFLRVHLLPGSFRSSYCDTDSMCLGLSRTQPIPENATLEQYYRCLFDPLVRPEMRDSWESQWKSWFVTTDTIEDQRKPGKLKSTFSHDHSIFYTIYTYKNLRGIRDIKRSFRRLVAEMLFHIRWQFRRDQKRHKRGTT